MTWGKEQLWFKCRGCKQGFFWAHEVRNHERTCRRVR